MSLHLPLKKPYRIEFESDFMIEKYKELATDFMQAVFDFEPGDYWISDRSRLCDFRGDSDFKNIHDKIQDIFGVSVANTDLLVDVFDTIERRRDRLRARRQ